MIQNLTPKKHFEVLDGLRGIAAISVVIFHFMESVMPYPENFIAHGYLAVDFFFCLSGYVIAYAYQDRLANLSFKNFAAARIIRLQPLIILGGVLGLLAFYFDPNATYQWNYSWQTIFTMLLGTWLVIPMPSIISERYLNNFNLNCPEWTLFWEYLANVVFAVALFRMKNIGLYILSALGAIAIIYVAFTTNDIMGGWGLETFWHGAARLGWSFMAGLLVFRLNLKIKNRLGFLGLSILLFLTFVFPYQPNGEHVWHAVYELFTVMILYPVIIALGVGTQVENSLTKLCKFSGDISYPIYMIHYAMLWLFINYYNRYKPTMGTVGVITAVCTLFMIGFSYLMLKVYDEPVRKWLSQWWKNR